MTEEDLSAVPLCRGMTPDECRQVLQIAQRVEVSPNEQIMTQGQLKNNLWIVLSGRCKVVRRTERGCNLQLAELGPNTQFGEMSFFHPSPHSADVIAQTDMELLCIAREDYDRQFSAGNPVALKLTLNCVEQLAERLRSMDAWITELVCNENHQPHVPEWTSFRELIFRGE